MYLKLMYQILSSHDLSTLRDNRTKGKEINFTKKNRCSVSLYEMPAANYTGKCKQNTDVDWKLA